MVFHNVIILRLTTDYKGASTIHSALKEISVLTPFVHKMTKRVGG